MARMGWDRTAGWLFSGLTASGCGSAFPQGGLEQRVLGRGDLGSLGAGAGGWAQRERQAEAMLPSPGPTCLAQTPPAFYQDQSPPGDPQL